MNETEKYIEAFNAGFLMRKKRPGLAETLVEGFSNPEHVYASGFTAGVKEFEKRKEQKLESMIEKQKKKQHKNAKKNEHKINKDL